MKSWNFIHPLWYATISFMLGIWWQTGPWAWQQGITLYATLFACGIGIVIAYSKRKQFLLFPLYLAGAFFIGSLLYKQQVDAFAKTQELLHNKQLILHGIYSG